ncbi:hypothetical protein PC129_g827 [Phytophthora cactorum]|uniref:Uncharacterized protein n=1 Tax=Phytophthora cactorum TaxID=29920 RepID=A0A329T213_9STRA|nr:hypothetical protein Pcac1_g1939 [Phytophthora cactorum]KAG2833506.1 hypothetical protein PC111_g6201 [Phytophthora cactorum]KAG2845526.1 hypothetical protein PC112_g1799 [Phytophthora cactorum]KAG2867915.1 hypothetical protein PC113_g1544 [Phytophthora cactorum]KAG2932830.1 hypothetical protein PC114_g1685 [Phytophthora cactorum]
MVEILCALIGETGVTGCISVEVPVDDSKTAGNLKKEIKEESERWGSHGSLAGVAALPGEEEQCVAGLGYRSSCDAP